MTLNTDRVPAPPADLGPLTFRLARPNDAVEVGALTSAAYVNGGHFAVDHPYIESLRNTGARLEDGPIVVAEANAGERDALVIGAVQAVPSGSPASEIAIPGEWEVRGLAVSPLAQGRGVGKRLVAELVEHVLKIDVTASAIVLSTMSTMREAQAVYAALGFVRMTARDWKLEYLYPELRHPDGLPPYLVYELRV